MKSTKAKQAKVVMAEKQVVKPAPKPRKTAADRKREADAQRDLWLQTTKIVVPAWFGNCSVKAGFALSQNFTPAGLLAMVSVGTSRGDESTNFGSCEVTMQMKLRPSGFDRQEARDLATRGFQELVNNKLVKQVKKATPEFPYARYQLSAKGKKWFDLLNHSAGCTETAV